MVYYFRQCGLFEVWEMLWIFKVARWTWYRWPKINKRLTVSNGVGASSFEIWTANMTQSLTMGTLTNSRAPKILTFRCGHFWLGIFFNAFILEWKKIKTCWMHVVFANWEKYEVSWNFRLVFIIHFLSCIPGSFDTVTSLRKGSVAKGQQLVWGQVG